MTKYSSKDRQLMEEKHGQRTIFDQIDESISRDVGIEENQTEEEKQDLKEEVTAYIKDNYEVFDKDNEKSPEDVEHKQFSLDQFGGQDAPYSDMLVGFDLTKDYSDPAFVVTALKECFQSISEFKETFGCEMAFAQKEDSECSRIVALYEKRVEVVRLKGKTKNNKSADAEAKAIEKLENDDYSSDESDILEKPSKVEKKEKKSKSSNKI